MNKIKLQLVLIISIIAMGLLVFSSCDATSHQKCYESVRAVFPNSKIYSSFDYKYRFIVIDSTGVKQVLTLNVTNAGISEITPLIEQK